MRSSILLSSALAIGAIASPLLDKRYYVTEVDLEIKTVTVYVTPGAPEPTAAAITSYGQRHGHSRRPTSQAYSQAPAPSSKAAPKPSSVYTPPPAYTPAPTPVQSSKAVPASSAPAPAGSHKSGDIQATFKSGPDYEAMVIYHHNAARANHDAGPLTWDSKAADAAGWSASQCIFDHIFPDNNALGHGQNIFLTSGAAPNASAGIIDSWYRGELAGMQGHYGSADIPEEVFHSVGHLTQMVWKGTTGVGCVSHDCSGGMKKKDGSNFGMAGWFLVCNYSPAGNVMTKYAENVQAPNSMSNLPNWND